MTARHVPGARQRKNGTWEVRFYVDGRRMSAYGKTAVAADRERKLIEQRLAKGGPARDARRTVEDWMTHWSEFSLPYGRKHTTITRYEGIIRNHINPELGRIRLADLRASHIERFIGELAKTQSASSTRQAYAVLKVALDDAVRDDQIGVNPVTRVKRPSVARKKPRILDPEDARAVLREIVEHRLYPLLLVYVLCGVRRGEAIAVRWSDVDLDRGRITFDGSIARNRTTRKLQRDAPKTEAGIREMPMAPALVTALKVHQLRQDLEKMEVGAGWGNGQDFGDLVFTTQIGTALEPRNINRWYTDAVRQATARRVGGRVADDGQVLDGDGQPVAVDTRIHSLRHAAGSAMYAVGEAAASQLLGHASLSITREFYAHPFTGQHQSAVDAVAALFDPEGGADGGKDGGKAATDRGL